MHPLRYPCPEFFVKKWHYVFLKGICGGSYCLSIPIGTISFDREDKVVSGFSTVVCNLPNIANKQFMRNFQTMQILLKTHPRISSFLLFLPETIFSVMITNGNFLTLPPCPHLPVGIQSCIDAPPVLSCLSACLLNYHQHGPEDSCFTY